MEISKYKEIERKIKIDLITDTPNEFVALFEWYKNVFENVHKHPISNKDYAYLQNDKWIAYTENGRDILWVSNEILYKDNDKYNCGAGGLMFSMDIASIVIPLVFGRSTDDILIELGDCDYSIRFIPTNLKLT